MDLTKRMKLERIGATEYRGFDYDNRAIHARPGQVIECSEVRGLRLLADFPHGFRAAGEPEGAAPSAAVDSQPAASVVSSPEPPRKRGRPRKAQP